MMKVVFHTIPNPLAPEHYEKLQSITSLLYETDLSKNIEPAELVSSFDEAEVRTYPAGSIIFMPEDPSCERLYILRQGRVDLYRLTASGKRLVTR